jgi:multicomponent K+:H+ antiporter subunit F
MLALVLPLAFGLLAVSILLCFLRLLKGPDLPDRLLALDTLYINAIALVVLFGIQLESSLFFESALLIAVMGFVGTLALSKYLLRGDIME